MQIYLINKNPIISKLVALSASKLGVEVVESQEINQDINAEIVLLDDECYEEESFKAYKESHKDAKIGLFYAKATERLDGFETYIQKPFLPTDLVKTLSELSGIAVIESPAQNPQENDLEFGEDAPLDLDSDLDFANLDDLQLDDEEHSLAQEGDLDAPLDFGAESEHVAEGIEETPESTQEMGEVKEAEEGQTEVAGGVDDSNAQLDFGAEEETPEEVTEPTQEKQATQVLDVSDVDTIKDLLKDDSEDSTSEESEHLLGVEDIDLDKELSGLGFEEDKEESGENTKEMQTELDNLQDEEESKDESLMELDADNLDSKDSDSSAESLAGFNLEEAAQDIESVNSLESMSETSGDDQPHEEENQQESQELDFSDLLDGFEEEAQTEALENAEEKVKEDEKAEIEESFSADSLEDFESADFTKDSEEMAVSDEEKQDSLEDLEIPQDFGDLAGETKGDEKKDDLGEENAMSLGDEFESLSLEGMGEALGEPVQKAPIPTPIVATEEKPPLDSKLQNIQANSLESLIGALQAMQTQNLKDLLSGATINISIQFPNKDDKK